MSDASKLFVTPNIAASPTVKAVVPQGSIKPYMDYANNLQGNLNRSLELADSFMLRYEQLQAKDAFNRFDTEINNYTRKNFYSKSGKDLVDAYEPVLHGLYPKAKLYSGELTGRAKDMFNQAANVKMQKTAQDLSTAAMKGMQVWTNKESEARINNLMNDAGNGIADWRNPNGTFQLSYNAAKNEIAENLTFNGIQKDTESFKFGMLSTMSQFHGGMVNNFLENEDVRNASAYLTQFKPEMTAADYAKYQTKLKNVQERLNRKYLAALAAEQKAKAKASNATPDQMWQERVTGFYYPEIAAAQEAGDNGKVLQLQKQMIEEQKAFAELKQELGLSEASMQNNLRNFGRNAINSAFQAQQESGETTPLTLEQVFTSAQLVEFEENGLTKELQDYIANGGVVVESREARLRYGQMIASPDQYRTLSAPELSNLTAGMTPDHQREVMQAVQNSLNGKEDPGAARLKAFAAQLYPQNKDASLKALALSQLQDRYNTLLYLSGPNPTYQTRQEAAAQAILELASTGKTNEGWLWDSELGPTDYISESITGAPNGYTIRGEFVDLNGNTQQFSIPTDWYLSDLGRDAYRQARTQAALTGRESDGAYILALVDRIYRGQEGNINAANLGIDNPDTEPTDRISVAQAQAQAQEQAQAQAKAQARAQTQAQIIQRGTASGEQLLNSIPAEEPIPDADEAETLVSSNITEVPVQAEQENAPFDLSLFASLPQYQSLERQQQQQEAMMTTEREGWKALKNMFSGTDFTSVLTEMQEMEVEQQRADPEVRASIQQGAAEVFTNVMNSTAYALSTGSGAVVDSAQSAGRAIAADLSRTGEAISTVNTGNALADRIQGALQTVSDILGSDEEGRGNGSDQIIPFNPAPDPRLIPTRGTAADMSLLASAGVDVDALYKGVNQLNRAAEDVEQGTALNTYETSQLAEVFLGLNTDQIAYTGDWSGVFATVEECVIPVLQEHAKEIKSLASDFADTVFDAGRRGIDAVGSAAGTIAGISSDIENLAGSQARAVSGFVRDNAPAAAQVVDEAMQVSSRNQFVNDSLETQALIDLNSGVGRTVAEAFEAAGQAIGLPELEAYTREALSSIRPEDFNSMRPTQPLATAQSLRDINLSSKKISSRLLNLINSIKDECLDNLDELVKRSPTAAELFPSNPYAAETIARFEQAQREEAARPEDRPVTRQEAQEAEEQVSEQLNATAPENETAEAPAPEFGYAGENTNAVINSIMSDDLWNVWRPVIANMTPEQKAEFKEQILKNIPQERRTPQLMERLAELDEAE